MSRLPIRARLTAAFALAMALVLAGSGLFVYLRLQADLDEAVDIALRDRVAAAAAGDLVPPEEAEEGFAQLLSADGRVVEAAGGARGPALRPEEARRAAREPLRLERRVPGVEATARVLARPAGNGTVAAAGQSLEDRDETLSGLVASFAIGGPLAILLASALGYALATAGLAPMEAMRRRAAEISVRERLPLPAAHDEVRRLGETLNGMLERLERSFQRERRFVADASHELRTPVAVVKTELEGALRGDLDPEVRAALTAAVDECDRLAQLAEDLLVLARSAEDGLPVRREPLDARSLLESVRDRFADRAAAQARAIEVAVEDGLELYADPLRMRQALGNLVDNALRHGEGEILLAARGGALDVSDGGPGFPRDVAGRAFERFARGDGARTRGGTGLGLAIVRAIAEAHGGSAEIVAGPGATVRIRLSQGQLS